MQTFVELARSCANSFVDARTLGALAYMNNQTHPPLAIDDSQCFLLSPTLLSLITALPSRFP